jgi:signal transduction histidine kinase
MKLRTKFSLLISLLVILIISGVTVSLLITESRFLVREMEQNRVNMVNSLAQIARESLIVKDEILLMNYLKFMKNTKGLLYAAVIDADGRAVAHTDPNLLGTALTQQAAADGVLDMAQPVFINDRKAGESRIGFSRAVLEVSVREALAVTRRRILLVALGALIAGIAGALLLTRMMTKPIKEIAAGAAIIGQGKLDHTIDVRSNDELGELARDFNVMSGRLKELDQLKSDFVSSVTHELRSPLLSIKMYIDLFLKGTAGAVNDKQKEYLTIIKDCSARLARFIDDLLDMAKIERGKMQVSVQPLEIAPVMRELVALFQPQADQKKIRLNAVVPDGLPKVLGDPDRTRQVITNLLSNAMKFTPENGTVTLEAQKTASAPMLEIAVSDTGIGIPADKLDRIFDKFEQVKDARTPRSGPKGTGLGLAIVKAIVEMQGGTIGVTSEMNRGSRFAFTLPLVKE